jgi:hypothetical protein
LRISRNIVEIHSFIGMPPHTGRAATENPPPDRRESAKAAYHQHRHLHRKDITLRNLLLAALLTLPMTPALAEVTITGARGTIEKSRDCQRAEGQATCTTGTLYTGQDGQTATKSRVRTTVPGASSTDITLTGPDGNTRTRNRLVTWGD